MPRGVKKDTKKNDVVAEPEPKIEEPEKAEANNEPAVVVEDVPAEVVEKVKKPRKKRTAKTTEDSNPPKKKRSKNVFMFFCEDNRARVKQENPDISVTEIAKKLGEEWQALDPAKKEPYLEKAAKAKEEFEALAKE